MRTSSMSLPKEIISETSRRQKAQQAIKGINKHIHTIAIITAENPMGGEADNEYDKRAMEELLRQLSVGHYKYFITKGKYGSTENSVMIYNITLDDTLYLCYKHNQESVVFVDITRPDVISYQHWEGDDHNSPLKLQHEEYEVVDATDDDDAYTKICRHFKFRIPFFEHIEKIENDLSLREGRIDIDRLISESLDSNRTGYSRYIKRGKLYGTWFYDK